MSERQFSFEATGSVAHTRIAPLLPRDWVDVTTTSSSSSNHLGEGGSSKEDESEQPATTTTIPDFLWENSQGLKSKPYRDQVKAYSHLPNGTNILDSKWVLGRVFSSHNDQQLNHQDEKRNDGADESSSESSSLLATLETHCFRGIDGFETFGNKVKIFDENDAAATSSSSKEVKYPDLLETEDDGNFKYPESPTNLWVLKDAMSNGAGGVWVVGPTNAQDFANADTTPLYDGHAYVAQRYVWPPVLFGGRKCHLRVYGLLTADNQAFIHQRCFLHVANDLFRTSDGDTANGGKFEDSIHITNCCANSHDDSKFAGEILADLKSNEKGNLVDGQEVIPLGKFMPSIKACISELAKKTLPFLQGGKANGGFEYMGIDFMLSYNDCKQPVAYILEVNAPPSQDTATGLPHAENLHNDVIRDLITMWVLPKVIPGELPKPGGWQCVYVMNNGSKPETAGKNYTTTAPIIPSKAAIINKIRWAMFEKRMSRAVQAEEEAEAVEAATAVKDPHSQELSGDDNKESGTQQIRCETVVNFARSQFPYFSFSVDESKNNNYQHQVFFENAGGSQVAQHVIDASIASLSHRHRSLVGTKTKALARETIRRILGTAASSSRCSSNIKDPIILGPNASSLLLTLANKYVEYSLLTSDDEIIVSTENHIANYDPWIKAAKDSGATIKHWTPFASTTLNTSSSSTKLEDLVTKNTRIVAIPHASNILGQVRDISKLAKMIKQLSYGHAHIVVDGVATVPHRFVNLADELSMVDWYVISCHKLFGSHLGGLCGKRNGDAVKSFFSVISSRSSSLSTPGGGTCDSTHADDDEGLYKTMETGTANYEACGGVVGLGNYFKSLSRLVANDAINEDDEEEGRSTESPRLSPGEDCSETKRGDKFAGLLPSTTEMVMKKDVKQAYDCIRLAELVLTEALFRGLRRSSKVRIVEGDTQGLDCIARLPIASFVHSTIAVKQLATYCQQKGYICRVSSFLCTEDLSKDLGFDYSEGVLRVSLAHYNNVQEVNGFIRSLESIPGWF